MTPQADFQKLLREQFYSLKQAHPRYSLRSFAKRISLSPGALCEIMAGQRNISTKTAARVVGRLTLSNEEKEKIILKFQKDESQGEKNSQTHFKLLSDQFRLIASWEHFSILALFQTINFRSQADWIARRLNLPVSRIEKALERLERLALINRTKKTWQRTTKSVETSDNVVDEAVHASHFEDLELAKEALDKYGIAARDYTSLTMAIDPKKIPEAKKAIRKFQAEMESLLEVHPQKEVYRLCIQLFPITNIKGESSK